MSSDFPQQMSEQGVEIATPMPSVSRSACPSMASISQRASCRGSAPTGTPPLLARE
ncbi:hypothetical protein [Aeromonas simiae]|uniref:hypothetical protein n=1 Tax=Aeromonas simiae TaxID=218936 RepID=UPI0018687C75|nr:hypothetical protein [Aeromonas simiae]